MPSNHLIRRYLSERILTPEENSWFEKLLSVDFPGRNTLKAQVASIRVTGYCDCGCKTIDLKADTNTPAFPYDIRVPVEMIVSMEDEIPAVFYLHVQNGYISELEVFKADSSSLHGQTIDINHAIVNTNIE